MKKQSITTVALLCINPTKTIRKDRYYKGIPVKKYDHGANFYNARLTRPWEQCSLDKATSFQITDEIGITRYISKKRFRILN